MDNKTLKALVIENKGDGMSFQAISDKLANEYNVSRSRQALQGMYQRAIKSNESEEQKERFVAMADIVNVYCLGYNMTGVTELVNKLGFNVSYNDVVMIIKEQQEYIEEVKKAITEKVAEAMKDSKYMTDINNTVVYKSILPTDKQLKNYIAEAFKTNIIEAVSSLLDEAYEFTDDKVVVKKIIEDLNIPIKHSRRKERQYE